MTGQIQRALLDLAPAGELRPILHSIAACTRTATAAFAHLIVWTVADKRSRETIARVQDADKHKTDLIGLVAHELRAPIQASIGFVGTVLMHWDRLSEDEKRSLLRRVERSASEQAHLVDGLLDLSRLGNGHSSSNPRTCDLSAEIRARIVDLAPLLESHEIVLTAPPTLHAFVDPELLRTVLTNLLTNALKFSPSGSTVTITALERGGEAILCVSDHGRGIEDQERHLIFEPFYQAGGHRCDRGGAGLGLALVKRCVDALGGRIWVETTPGLGSAFFFSVPISHRGDAPASTTERNRPRVMHRRSGDRRSGADRRLSGRRGVAR